MIPKGKVLYLKGRFRCRGCGRKGRQVDKFKQCAHVPASPEGMSETRRNEPFACHGSNESD
jgi:hypothetical protein